MKIIIIGATGATGKDLLDLALADNAVETVTIFVRKPVPSKTHKLSTHLINFDDTDSWRHLVKGDVLFSCLGTTLKDAGSKGAQWKVDYGYQYNFAKAAKDNGVKTFVLVSSAMANAGSPIFYTKMKGELEEAVKALDFERLIIFNPPVLERKNSTRSAEIAAVSLLRFLNKFSIAKSNEPLPTNILAQALLNSAKKLGAGFHRIEGREIRKFTRSATPCGDLRANV